MYLKENHILGNELMIKMGIHQANLSMASKKYKDENNTDIRKLGNCVIINKDSKTLPETFKRGIAKHELTDLTNMIPLNYFMSEFDLKLPHVKEIIKQGYFEDIISIYNNKFIKVNKDFVKKTKDSIFYKLNKTETEECLNKGYIDGYIKLNNNLYLTWYSVESHNPNDNTQF